MIETISAVQTHDMEADSSSRKKDENGKKKFRFSNMNA
jgi:hypothetical protein